ncbi:hypothetical protein BOO69_18990 (plasmid) [Sulfitobacter alexandrii]|uniref:Uncharacterized protein n=1 Tax=Sulfitobacter alexandrii TaxID=1917485 RepID=A0A1J0WMX0_9RHOB|nr:hypothetical protein [Sulfitobacter alexandrii]APE45650.1 hypothetical protein BOO69_18990 [Sulfitobacter alexandrii]
MNSEEIQTFLKGRSVYGLDPDTHEVVACIDYGTDGTCLCRFANGDTDKGVYGFEGDTYWTRYETFREGKRHAFRLERKGPGVAQAYFTDGRIAFLQSHDAKPDIRE